MKKLILPVFILLFTANFAIAETKAYDQCFDEAIEFLEDLEDGVGFPLTVDDATEVLNDAYAACYCLNSPSACGIDE